MSTAAKSTRRIIAAHHGMLACDAAGTANDATPVAIPLPARYVAALLSMVSRRLVSAPSTLSASFASSEKSPRNELNLLRTDTQISSQRKLGSAFCLLRSRSARQSTLGGKMKSAIREHTF